MKQTQTTTKPEKPITAKSLVRKSVIQDRDVTTAALMTMLSEAGHPQISKASVAEWRTETRGVLSVVDELNLVLTAKATPTPTLLRPKRVRVRSRKAKASTTTAPLPVAV